MFSPSELELLEVLSDPVKWITVTTGEIPRWYQTDMLRNPSIRKVSRMGRRTGKTWTMAAHMLWYAFTHEHAALVVATPYENQITLIFDQLRKFISKAPELQDSLITDRRNPQHLQFRNGSYIKGFTAGTKSGAAGGSLRGQRADWLYLDEVDYMTDDDFDTIFAITLEAPQRIGVWVASTPTGRRGTFWRLCTDKEAGWQEFHHPTTVNPEWSPAMEKELRAMFSTQVAWDHEVLAEFGDETIGVFKKEYIDRAKRDYPYVPRAAHTAIRTIGVDWDKYGAESQIVVLEFDEVERKFRVIQRVAVPKSEFTLHNTVRKVVELNDAFRPNLIYVDRGYGEYQVETFHIYGAEHPESGLRDKLKGWAFNEHYEVRDPITKELRKTPIKPFMVNQVVYLLEQDLLIINEKDDVMWKQMENYQVIRITQTGQPVFTSENEHTIDALMLAVLAMQLEYPHLADIMKKTEVAREFGSAQLQYVDPLKSLVVFSTKKDNKEPVWDEPGLPPPKRVPVGYTKKSSSYSWGARGTSDPRKEPFRKKW